VLSSVHRAMLFVFTTQLPGDEYSIRLVDDKYKEIIVRRGTWPKHPVSFFCGSHESHNCPIS